MVHYDNLVKSVILQEKKKKAFQRIIVRIEFSPLGPIDVSKGH